jgi:DNA repair exonuclease SbcCD ATPase subunit
MKIKHKLLSDYQFLSSEKKIFLIKSGTIIEEYLYKIKNESISIDKQIVDANPEIFQIIDWKAEMLSYMKSQKFPTPSQFHKKLIPFIEEMVLSSIQQNSGPVSNIDESKVKELEWKEIDLNNREKRIKDKEEEIDIRLKRVEKREDDHKQELKNLDKKEDDLRSKSRDLTEKQLELEDKIQDFNEKERNFDRSLLESSANLDSKYAELQSKIDKDLRQVTEKEKDLEVLSKEVKRKEEKLQQLESEIDDKIRNFEIQKEEWNLFTEEIRNIDKEIKDWEKLHWKFKRNRKPPSCE